MSGRPRIKRKIKVTRAKNVGVRVHSPPPKADDNDDDALLQSVEADSRRLMRPPPEQESRDPDSDSDSSLGLPPQRPPIIVRRERPPRDDTLGDIINLRKVRSVRLNPSDLSSAASSPRVKNRRSVLMGQPPSDDSGTDADTEDDFTDAFRAPRPSTPSLSRREHKPHHRSRKHKHRHRHRHRRHRRDGGSDRHLPSGYKCVDPVEAETLKTIERAKLLARIEQLEKRNDIRASKKFNWKSSIDEMRTEVAKMEIIDVRGSRIQQGRTMLMLGVGAVEKSACKLDDGQFVPDPDGEEGEGSYQGYIPGVGGDNGWKFCMKDYSKTVIGQIEKYDDCLERGVEEMLGPQEGRKWYIDLLAMLIPSMIMYSMTNRLKNDPEHTAQVLMKNPNLREEVVKELAKQMADERRSGDWSPGGSSSSSSPSPDNAPPVKNRMVPPAPRKRKVPVNTVVQPQRMQAGYGTHMAARRMVPPGGPPPSRKQPVPVQGRAPPIVRQPNYHPSGDHRVDPSQTRMMIMEMERAKEEERLRRLQKEAPVYGTGFSPEKTLNDDDPDDLFSDYETDVSEEFVPRSPLQVRTGADKRPPSPKPADDGVTISFD